MLNQGNSLISVLRRLGHAKLPVLHIFINFVAFVNTAVRTSIQYLSDLIAKFIQCYKKAQNAWSKVAVPLSRIFGSLHILLQISPRAIPVLHVGYSSLRDSGSWNIKPGAVYWDGSGWLWEPEFKVMDPDPDPSPLWTAIFVKRSCV